MLDLERLRKDLVEKKGCSKAQANSRAVAKVLDLLTDSGDRYETLDDIESKITSRTESLKYLQERYESSRERVKEISEKINEIKADVNKTADARYKQIKEYIDSFYKSLEECETPKGRDLLKVAQVYVNTVQVRTGADNTAFILGLAAILSGGKIATGNEIKKVDPKVPVIRVEMNPFEMDDPHSPYEITTGSAMGGSWRVDDDPWADHSSDDDEF